MADRMSKKKRSEVMSRIRSTNTLPERILRRAIRSAGYCNYRLKNNLPGRPDIFFPKRKLAVFVHGCFWHGCRNCYVSPQTNAIFWENKLSINKQRDKVAVRKLRRAGWTVITIWEHEISRNPDMATNKITKILK